MIPAAPEAGTCQRSVPNPGRRATRRQEQEPGRGRPDWKPDANTPSLQSHPALPYQPSNATTLGQFFKAARDRFPGPRTMSPHTQAPHSHPPCFLIGEAQVFARCSHTMPARTALSARTAPAPGRVPASRTPGSLVAFNGPKYVRATPIYLSPPSPQLVRMGLYPWHEHSAAGSAGFNFSCSDVTYCCCDCGRRW